MSGQGLINGRDFARNACEMHGEIAAAALRRVQDGLYDDAGSIRWSLRGGLNARNQPVLDVTIDGELHLRCERCLGPLAHRVQVARQLVLVAHASDLLDPAEEEEHVDTVLLDQETDVAALIEDEVLLSLPFAPRHADGQCAAPRDLEHVAETAASPFASLAQLQRRRPANS